MATKKKEETKIETPEVSIIPKNVPTLELVQLTANSFQGFDRSKPLVIDFRNHKKGENITIATGDQGVGKTSTIHALLYACGVAFDFKLENLVNLTDNTLSGEFQFKSERRSYKVAFTKTKFELYKLFRDADDPKGEPIWQPQGTPKEMLKKLLGHIATDPMFLKEEKGDKQVKWLYSILNVPDDIKTKESELKETFEIARVARVNANRDYERIKAALSENELYLNWEASEAFYKEEKTIESQRLKLNEVDIRRQKFISSEVAVKTFKQNLKSKDIEIEQLEVRIALLKKEKSTLEKRIVDGDKYIKENKSVETEYEKTYEDFTQLNKYVIGRNNWISTKHLKSEMDEFHTALVDLDVKKDKISKQLKDLVKKILPPIDGFEVQTEQAIDSKRDVGIYLNGKTPAQLSESELYKLYLELLSTQETKPKIVVIENINSMGSLTIQTINEMAADGILIFATMVDRSIKDLAVVFKTEIE